MKRFPVAGRKLLTAVCLLIVVLSLSGCLSMVVSLSLASYKEAAPIRSLGSYVDSESYIYGEFQDYTIYEKYYFSSYEKFLEHLSENPYFSRVHPSDLDYINEHLDDFEGWVDFARMNDPSHELVLNYDFDRSILDTEDYFYIESESSTWSIGHTSLVKYDVYIFDVQSLVLYLLHNNI